MADELQSDEVIAPICKTFSEDVTVALDCDDVNILNQIVQLKMTLYLYLFKLLQGLLAIQRILLSGSVHIFVQLSATVAFET